MSSYICTWIYLDSKEEESSYTQVGNNSSDVHFQEVYWRCVYVFFCSSVKNNPKHKHILFTNSREIPTIKDLSIRDELSKLGVQFITLPLTFRVPTGYFNSWRNQFYIFDILQHIGENFSDEDCFLILDSDCLWLKPADEIMNHIHQHGILPYFLNASVKEEIHGLNRLQMKELFEELLGYVLPTVPEYLGGEWFAATGKYIRELNAHVPAIWKQSMERHEQGTLKCNEEAHMLSALYYKVGYDGYESKMFVRRIWTISSIRRDVTDEDLELTVWHCPSEKKYGITRLFEDIIKNPEAYWQIPSGNEFRDFVGQYVGIHREQDRLYPVEEQLRKQIEFIQTMNHKSICIFGSGVFGQSVLKLLREYGIYPSYFVDNDNKKWGSNIEGLRVIGSDSLDETSFIIIASYASADIRQQLLHQGLKEQESFVIYSFYNEVG